MSRNPAPAGTTKVIGRGYVYVKLGKGHRDANSTGWQYEHRLVMAEKLGRPLRPGESIRHVNGDYADNTPDNLELVGRVHDCPDCSC